VSLKLAEKLCKKLRGKSDLTVADRIGIAIHIEHRQHEVSVLITKVAEREAEIATLRAAAQQALDAWGSIWACTLPDEETDAVENAVNALQSALKGTP
jgi:hypothetical protein